MRARRRRLIVSDVGSMKVPIAAEAMRWSREFDYVGLHPLAGGEHNGWQAAAQALFRGRTIVHCPAGARETRVARELTRLVGGVPVAMGAAAHDAMAAETIGLPHLVAFAAAALRPPATSRHPLRGTSWGSLTRVSVSDPAFVAGLLHPNAAHQLRVARAFISQFEALCRHLERPTGRPLEQALRRAAGKR
jgi:prephenate dehydrogenase